MIRLGLCVFLAAWVGFGEMGPSQPVAQPRVVARVAFPALSRKRDSSSAGACFSPSGEMLAVCCREKVKICKLPSGRELIEFPGHTDFAAATRFSPDGTRFVSMDSDENVRIWRISVEEWTLIDEIESGDVAPSPERSLKMRVPSSAYAHGLAFSPDARLLAWVSRPFHREDRVKVWDLERREEVAVLPVDGLVDLVTFSSDGSFLKAIVVRRVRARDVHQIRLWSTSTFERENKTSPRYELDLHHWGQRSFSPDAELRVEFKSTGELLRVTHLTTGRSAVYPGFPPVSPELKRTLGPGIPGLPTTVVCSMVVSPDKTTVAIGTNQAGAVVLWDVPAGRPRARLDNPAPGAVSTFASAFSPDGGYLFTISYHRPQEVGQTHGEVIWERVGLVWDVQGDGVTGQSVYRQ